MLSRQEKETIPFNATLRITNTLEEFQIFLVELFLLYLLIPQLFQV